MVTIPPQLTDLGPKTDRPRLNPSADLTAFPLTPTEAFVLSRVDGNSTYEEICRVSGLGAEPTLQILRRFKRVGIILNASETLRGTPSRTTPTRTTPAAGRPEERSLLERLDDRSLVDPIELASGPDLSPELKMRIVRLHRRLKKLEPHEMLGLKKGAARSEVKRAYFAASKELHPDRFFGRDIGFFRDKLGDIFVKLTEAFQTLDKK